MTNSLAPTPLVWIVDSAYTGELNARIGVADRLGFGYETVPLPQDDSAAYERMLWERYVETTSDREPRRVILLSGTGEDTTAPIADIKNLFRERLFNVYLASILPDELDPRLEEYDLIASPQLTGANVVTTLGVAHKVTSRLLERSFHRHRDRFAGVPRPLVGLLVGGNTRYCFGFDEAHARSLGRRVAAIVEAIGGGLAITNSRRTPDEAMAALLEELAHLDYRFFDWRHSDADLYPALLAHGDIFVATGDSVSMCSEASFTGKPLLIDIQDYATEIYHRDIIAKLFEYGAARPLTDAYDAWTYVPPDPTGEVAEAIRERLQAEPL